MQLVRITVSQIGGKAANFPLTWQFPSVQRDGNHILHKEHQIPESHVPNYAQNFNFHGKSTIILLDYRLLKSEMKMNLSCLIWSVMIYKVEGKCIYMPPFMAGFAQMHRTYHFFSTNLVALVSNLFWVHTDAYVVSHSTRIVSHVQNIEVKETNILYKIL